MLGVAKRWFNLYLSWRSYLVLGSAIVLQLISSFLFSAKSVRGSLSLSRSHTVARLIVTLRSVCDCDWIWWTFGPLLWAFFLLKDPHCVLGLCLLKRERNEMEMCTKETRSRFQLMFFLYFRKIFFKWKLWSPNLIYIFNKIIFDNWDWGIWIPTKTNI